METRTQAPTEEESTIVERVARIVSSVRGKKPDYTRLATELEFTLPFDVFGVVLLRHDRQAVRITVCTREADVWVANQHQHPFKDSHLARLSAKPEIKVCDYPEGLDGPPEFDGDALSPYHFLRSTLIAPLTVGERVLGTLELGSVTPQTYTDPSLRRMIEAFVHVLAAAIESAQDGGSVAIQNRQREVLKDVSHALTSADDLTEVFARIVSGIRETLNVASALILVDQWGERDPHIEIQDGLDRKTLSRLIENREALEPDSIIGYSLRQRRPSVSKDIERDEHFPRSRCFASELGIHTLSSFPLVSGPTVYGTLLLCSPEVDEITPLKADIISLFATQATIALHNRMLLEAAQRRQHFKEALDQLGEDEENLDELEELERLRVDCQRIYGVSLGQLLRFIGGYLFTGEERDLPVIFPSGQRIDRRGEGSHIAESRADFMLAKPEPQSESLSLLAQSAERSLARVSMLSSLSRLLQIYDQEPQGSGNMGDAWIVIDTDGYCVYLNPAAEAFSNLRNDPTTGHMLEDVFSSFLQRARNLEQIKIYLHECIVGDPQRQELRCTLAAEVLPPVVMQDQASGRQRKALKPDGLPSDLYFQLKRYPLYDQNDQYIGNALQVSDITTQVRDEKNKAVLLSSVSHDLRTPLTTIKAAVSGLLQPGVEWEEEIKREMLVEIDEETERLTSLVSSLVEMSRIGMGALVLEKEWCDIQEIVYRTQSRISRVLDGREVQINVVHPPLPLVQADYVQLERVFSNLIENAAHHSPANAAILVELHCEDEDILTVNVIDEGHGVPEAERERIFQSFYSLNSQGNGLGLAICRGIIEAHHGNIWVEEARTGGSCFVFTLPVRGSSVLRSRGKISVSVEEQS